MKILHVCLANFYIDGYGYQENMLPKYHVLQGHQVEVLASLVSFDKSGKPCLLEQANEYSTKDGYKVIRIDYKRPMYHINKRFRRYNRVYQHIENFGPDIIFFHDCQFWDIFEAIKYLKKHSNVKVFVDSHTDHINSARNWLSREILHKIIWKHCAQAISPFTEKFFGVLPMRCDFYNKVYGIPREKLDLLVMGVDDELIPYDEKDSIRINVRRELGLDKDDFVLITGGKIDRKKNIHLLMQAVGMINSSKLKLIIFGNVAREVENQILNLAKNHNIKYLGWKNSETLYRYFFAADLAVFPGTHSVLWEYAIGCGLPTVFKKWAGMEHVDLGGNSIFLTEDSVDELVRVINSIFSDKQFYNKMEIVAKTKGIEEFKYSEIAKKAIQISR
ncbi:MAG: glycosyltransferase family 4 protein [Solirubrobacterales bacterium]